MAQFDPDPVANAVEFSVAELAFALKRTLEDRFGYVRVRGEVTGYRGPHASGHAYFALKDDSARLDAVVWRTTFSRLKVKPQEGLEVVVSGRIGTFASKSSYQIVVEDLEPAGVGALMTLLESRRRSLAAEGLFDSARKRPLPKLPKLIGVVTSPSGAVIRDILHRIGERFPRGVLLWPVKVQGGDAAEEIATAIRGMNALATDISSIRPDVLIVARGGGSLEDLWPFNEEEVVRAAAESVIPVVSAVGHETDWTLIDYAADVRAPTPTAAAEFCVPVREELVARLSRLRARCEGAMSQKVGQSAVRLRSASRGAAHIRGECAGRAQRVDIAASTLKASAERNLRNGFIELLKSAAFLARRSPISRLNFLGERVNALWGANCFMLQALFRDKGARCQHAVHGLGLHFRSTSDRRTNRHDALVRLWRAQRVLMRDRLLSVRLDTFRAVGIFRRVWFDEIRRRQAGAAEMSKLFSTYSLKSVLSRGFALVLGERGKPIGSAATARAARRFKIRFADGEIVATASTRRTLTGKHSADQGDLF